MDKPLGLTVPFNWADFEDIEVAEPVATIGGFNTVLKVAVTLTFAFMVTWQVVVVPEQPPDQPLNTEFASGVAVKVTWVPAEKLVPAGLVKTLPLPVPFLVMVRL